MIVKMMLLYMGQDNMMSKSCLTALKNSSFYVKTVRSCMFVLSKSLGNSYELNRLIYEEN